MRVVGINTGRAGIAEDLIGSNGLLWAPVALDCSARGCTDLWYYRWHLFVVWVSLSEPAHFSPPLALLCSHPHTLSATVSPAGLEILWDGRELRGSLRSP